MFVRSKPLIPDFDIDAMLMDQLLRHEKGLPEIAPEAYLAQIAQHPIRTAQAKRYWNLKVGKALKYKKFKDYLASIPAISPALHRHDPEFPLLVLVEPRIGLKRLCDHGIIAFSGNDETFVAYDVRHAEFEQPTWIRIQDGRKNRCRSVKGCRETFAKQEFGLTALQSVCTYLQHPTVVSEWTKEGSHVMFLPGSVRREYCGNVAGFYVDQGLATLSWYGDVDAGLNCGSASRG